MADDEKMYAKKACRWCSSPSPCNRIHGAPFFCFPACLCWSRLTELRLCSVAFQEPDMDNDSSDESVDRWENALEVVLRAFLKELGKLTELQVGSAGRGCRCCGLFRVRAPPCKFNCHSSLCAQCAEHTGVHDEPNSCVGMVGC
jgi:hypothetical protein